MNLSKLTIKIWKYSIPSKKKFLEGIVIIIK